MEILYFENYLEGDPLKDNLWNNISKIFQNEEKHRVELNNASQNGVFSYKLNRKTLVFADPDVNRAIIPKIWGKGVTILPFDTYIAALKDKLEKDLNFKFNICLANYYENGKSGIAFHSDNEELGSTSCIASISLGEERNFLFRSKETMEIVKTFKLKDGSLLVMGDGCQENYQHSVPIDKTVHGSRLNLTFRLFDQKRYENY